MAALTAYVKGDPKSGTLGDCPFCHRVLLTLEGKQIPYTREYIDFDHKPEWLLQAAGGKVPVIKEGDGPYLADSDKIVEYLEQKFPEPSMKARAPSDLGSKLFPSFRNALLGPAEEQEQKLAQLRAELGSVSDYLSSHGPLLGGEHLDAIDAALAPKIYHAVVALEHFKGLHLLSEFPAIKKYLDTLSELPAWKNSDYGHAALIKGWQRHLDEQK